MDLNDEAVLRMAVEDSAKDPGVQAAVEYLSTWHINGEKLRPPFLNMIVGALIRVSDRARKAAAEQPTSD